MCTSTVGQPLLNENCERLEIAAKFAEDFKTKPLLWSKWNVRFGWEREENTGFLGKEGTCIQKTDQMPELTVH